ncbi:9603_t:CDS:2 [Acaulospora morrowiae]|uniref:9603_t:CDS:1 n=1 Tax=Acaulospora morrowiae TaxID=94023 RepID=A0A9N9DDJ2_9GLOM|nr:9603_t:CDS:2 [Acaulospora morrowiae]
MEIKPSYKELIHTMEFEPYKPKYIDWSDDEETDEEEEFKYEIDSDAFRCSSGIVVSENDLDVVIKIDLEDFNIDYQVCNNILAIFGTKKPSTKNILLQNFEDVVDPSATTNALFVPETPTTIGGRREYKSFCHPVSLPENVDTEKIYSEIIDGIMRLENVHCVSGEIVLTSIFPVSQNYEDQKLLNLSKSIVIFWIRLNLLKHRHQG